jgi:hypothetical protein
MSKVLEKLLSVQLDLKAPKNQRNNFGGYNYRSCEDILEAVKPLCMKHQCLVILSDDMVCNGNRYHIKATARFYDMESGEFIENSAFAREAETKKGMDDSQITGTASSYARKYALNGLFCIDDTKDADTKEYRNQNAVSNASSKPTEPPQPIMCNVCGNEIKGAKRGAQMLTGAQVAAQTGGRCMACYKAAQAK